MRLVVLVLFLSAIVLTMSFKNSIRDDPNEQCSWRGDRICPIDSSGSNPVCDNTVPVLVSPGVYGMTICASESPKALGGKFEVGLAIYGTILTVDVVPQSTKE